MPKVVNSKNSRCLSSQPPSLNPIYDCSIVLSDVDSEFKSFPLIYFQFINGLHELELDYGLLIFNKSTILIYVCFFTENRYLYIK